MATKLNLFLNNKNNKKEGKRQKWGKNNNKSNGPGLPDSLAILFLIGFLFALASVRVCVCVRVRVFVCVR